MFEIAQARLGRGLRVLAGIALTAVLALPAPVAVAQGSVDEKKINDLIAKMTLEEKIQMLSGSTLMSSAGVKRLGIPEFRMSDGPVGAHIPPPSTAYAAGIGLAASWDRELAKSVGTQLGRDGRSRGIGYLLGPGVNIYRAPMNGRNFEYFGEDPFLAARDCRGLHRRRAVAGSERDHQALRRQQLASISASHPTPRSSERALREIYLPAFEAAVKEGARGLDHGLLQPCQRRARHAELPPQRGDREAAVGI